MVHVTGVRLVGRAVAEALVVCGLGIAVLVLFPDFGALISLGAGVHALGVPFALGEAERPFLITILVL